YLTHKTIGTQQIYQPSVGELSDVANHNTRIPFGHPEGYLEAFANIYKNFATTVSKTMNGETPNEFDLDYPKIEDGIRGMEFIDAVIKSGEDSTWVKM
ncbi:MAG: gfo/Idh/MocA family oxidoreductase, partial [Spirosomaceae bacterium]|nr:gfo/Idh/MocA family oxidoreductase [Spirosomataceae bacterium]